MEQKSLAAFNQRGVLGLTGIALGTAFALAALQQLLLATRPSLTAASKPIFLNRSARLDPDPIRRREARLISWICCGAKAGVGKGRASCWHQSV